MQLETQLPRHRRGCRQRSSGHLQGRDDRATAITVGIDQTGSVPVTNDGAVFTEHEELADLVRREAQMQEREQQYLRKALRGYYASFIVAQGFLPERVARLCTLTEAELEQAVEEHQRGALGIQESHARSILRWKSRKEASSRTALT